MYPESRVGDRPPGRWPGVPALPRVGEQYVRELCYADAQGRLTDERLRVDWDRDGTPTEFEASASYNELDLLTSRVLPHPVGAEAWRYDYHHARGTVTSVTAFDGTDDVELVGTATGAGLLYNAAGGLREASYANGTLTQTAYTPGYLPERITMDDGSGALAFDTGIYSYDGAGNITTLGADTFSYDGAGRLDAAHIDLGGGASVDLDYLYDPYGNMLSRDTAAAGPPGLHFLGRTFGTTGTDPVERNWIRDPDFAYDRNGNLVQEPTHEQVGGFNYHFTGENRLAYVQEFAQAHGRVVQEAQYDPSGHRWVRMLAEGRGEPLLSLRDASGQVVADYATPVGDYTITIETDAGQRRVLTRTSSLPDTFGIHENEFFANVTNWVRIQATAECGQTGYSNAVSLNPGDIGGGGCLENATASRGGFSDGTPSVLQLEATISGCDEDLLYHG